MGESVDGKLQGGNFRDKGGFWLNRPNRILIRGKVRVIRYYLGVVGSGIWSDKEGDQILRGADSG